MMPPCVCRAAQAVKKMLLERCTSTGASHIEVPVTLPLASADDVVAAVEAHITPVRSALKNIII